MNSKKPSVVMAGCVLGVEEEFVAGHNTFVDDDGNVVSQAAGVCVSDPKSHGMEVIGRRNLVFLSPGTDILGRVVMVSDHVAVIEVLKAKKGRFDVAVPNSTCAVPVSKADVTFVKSVREKFRAGDVVMARVASVSPWGVDLSTQSAELGVVKAFCTRCRQVLVLQGRDLKCLQCDRVESRKVSSDYWFK